MATRLDETQDFQEGSKNRARFTGAVDQNVDQPEKVLALMDAAREIVLSWQYGDLRGALDSPSLEDELAALKDALAALEE